MRLFGLLGTAVGFDSAAAAAAAAVAAVDTGSLAKLALGLRLSLLLLFNITGIRESVALAPSSAAAAVESTVSFAVVSATTRLKELSD